MNIVVCIKQVPDTTEVKLDKETGTLIRNGIPSIINPDDKSALELALQLKADRGASVTVLTMGPPQAKEALMEALSMGADEAILLTDRKFAGSDTWSTSLTLAAAIQNVDYDLVICGRQAIDGDTAQVGPQIAEHLGIPQVTYCESLEMIGHKLRINRQYEGGHFVVAIEMPCLITALSQQIESRYMTVGGIIDAYAEKKIVEWTNDNIEVDEKELGLKGSPTRVRRSMTKTAKSAGEKHDVEAVEGAAMIYEQLVNRKYLQVKARAATVVGTASLQEV